MKKLLIIFLLFPILADCQLRECWSMNGNSNGIINALNGTDHSMTYVPGIFNQAGNFNGSSGYISLPGLGISGGTARTISVWINCTATSIHAIINFGGWSADGVNFGLYVPAYGTSDITMGFYYPDCYTGNILANNGKWNLVTVVYDGGVISTSTLHIYLNGGSKSMTINKANVTANTTDANNNIGARTVDGGAKYYFLGKIDDVKYGGLAWSSAAVKNQYIKGKTAFSQ